MSELLQNAGQLQHSTQGGNVSAARTLRKEEIQKIAEEKGCAVALALVEVAKGNVKAPCLWRGCLLRPAVKDATGSDDELRIRTLLVAGVSLSLQEVDRKLEEWLSGLSAVALRAAARCALARTPCYMELALAGALRPVQVLGARDAMTEGAPCSYQVHACLYDDGSSGSSSSTPGATARTAATRPALVFMQAAPAVSVPTAPSPWPAPLPLPIPTTATTALGYWPVTTTLRSSIVVDAANVGSLPSVPPPLLAVDGAACCVTVVQFPAGLVLFQNPMSRQYVGNVVGKNLGTTMLRQLLGGSTCPEVSRDPLGAMFLALAAGKEFETIVQVPAIPRDLKMAAPEPPTELAAIAAATATATTAAAAAAPSAPKSHRPQPQRPNSTLTELLVTVSEQGALETLDTEDRMLLEALMRQEPMAESWGEAPGGGCRTAAEALRRGVRRSISLQQVESAAVVAAAGPCARSPSGALAFALNRPVLSLSRARLCGAARQGGGGGGGAGCDGVQQLLKQGSFSVGGGGSSGGGARPQAAPLSRQMSQVPELSGGSGGGRSRLAIANGSSMHNSAQGGSRAAGGDDWDQVLGSKVSELANWLLAEVSGGAAGQQGPRRGTGPGPGPGQRQEWREGGGGQRDTALVIPKGGPGLLAPRQPGITVNSLSQGKAGGGGSGSSARLGDMHARPSYKYDDVWQVAVYTTGASRSQSATLPVGLGLMPTTNQAGGTSKSLGAPHPARSFLSRTASNSPRGAATAPNPKTDNWIAAVQMHAVQLLTPNGRSAAAPAAAAVGTAPGSGGGDGASRACASPHTQPQPEGAAGDPLPTAAAASTNLGGGGDGLGAASPDSSLAAAVAITAEAPPAGAGAAQAAAGIAPRAVFAGGSYAGTLITSSGGGGAATAAMAACGAAAAPPAPPHEGSSGPECMARPTVEGGAGRWLSPPLGEDPPEPAAAAASVSNGAPAAAAAAAPGSPPGGLLQGCSWGPNQAATVQATSPRGSPDGPPGRVEPPPRHAAASRRGSSPQQLPPPPPGPDPNPEDRSRGLRAASSARRSSSCSQSPCPSWPDFSHASDSLTLASLTIVRRGSLSTGRDEGRPGTDVAPCLLVAPYPPEEPPEQPQQSLIQPEVSAAAAATAATAGEPAAAAAPAAEGKAAASGCLRREATMPTPFAAPARPDTASGVPACVAAPMVAAAASAAAAAAAATAGSAAACASCKEPPTETASAVAVTDAVTTDSQCDGSERSSPAIATATVLSATAAAADADADEAPCFGPSSAQLLIVSAAIHETSETEAVADSTVGFLVGPSRDVPGRPSAAATAAAPTSAGGFVVQEPYGTAGPTARSGPAVLQMPMPVVVPGPPPPPRSLQAPLRLPQQPRQRHQEHPQQQGKGRGQGQGQARQTTHPALSLGRHDTLSGTRMAAGPYGSHGRLSNVPAAFSSSARLMRQASGNGDDDGGGSLPIGGPGGRLSPHLGRGSSANTDCASGVTAVAFVSAHPSMAQLPSRGWLGGGGGGAAACAAAAPVAVPAFRAGTAAAVASRGGLRDTGSAGICGLLELSQEFSSQRELPAATPPSASGWPPGRARQRSGRSFPLRSQNTGRRLTQLLNSLGQTQAYPQVQRSESSRSTPQPGGAYAFLEIAPAADAGSSTAGQTTDPDQPDSAAGGNAAAAGQAAAFARTTVLSSAGLARPSGVAATSSPRLWHKVAVRVVASQLGPSAVAAMTATTTTTRLVQPGLIGAGAGGQRRPSAVVPPASVSELNSVIGEAMGSMSAERALTVTVTQIDVTEQVEAQAKLARLLEQEHKVLEGIFPRHVIEYMTLQGGARQAEAPSPIGGGRHASSLLTLFPGGLERMASLATWHPGVTILFADCVGFTSMCHAATPLAVMAFLNQLYSRFDAMIDIFKVYKVETIGDCYMVAGGLVAYDDDGYKSVISGQEDPLHAVRVMEFAKAMLRASREVCMPHTGQPVQMRIGLHSGPVTSGVVGERMPRFCLFGDTVNVASRMESTCRPGHIHVSAATQARLPSEAWRDCGLTAVKGKGEMQTYEWAGNVEAPVDDGQLQRIIGLYL